MCLHYQTDLVRVGIHLQHGLNGSHNYNIDFININFLFGH